jgi:sirohydrochlorin cobaltochelatase
MHGESSKQLTSAVLLVGHGTRDELGLREFDELAVEVGRRLGNRRVRRAFLELAEPSISEAIDRLAAEGVRSILVVPLFLFAAGHVKHDVPAAVDKGVARHRELRIDIAPAFGCDEEILALSARRFEESLAGRADVPRQRTMLLLVGRGTRDADAVDEVRRLAALRHMQSSVGNAEVCFVAAARPTLEEGLRLAAEAGFPRVVVQPHLLFAGQVLDDVRAAVKLIEREAAGVEWIVAEHLGPAEELVRAILGRVN